MTAPEGLLPITWRCSALSSTRRPDVHPARLHPPPSALSAEVMWGSSSAALSLGLPPPGARCQGSRLMGVAWCPQAGRQTWRVLGKAESPPAAADPQHTQPWPARPAGATWPEHCRVTVSTVNVTAVDQTARAWFIKDIWIMGCDVTVKREAWLSGHK